MIENFYLRINQYISFFSISIRLNIFYEQILFAAIGKAFSVLSDAQKRKQYDNYGPESFEASGETSTRSSHGHRSQYGTHYSWNEEEFSADELFNLFFGGTTAHSSHTRRRQQAQQHAHASSNGANFTFTQSQVGRHPHFLTHSFRF